ncbi:LuxR C-terminal-related transcriptional regulator, partial [Streptomyces sp. SID10853]|uniref:helix-turn-helix transcriptional regulator n=1 Tax=Streptomyces sp. SID10853 TaxID=2706028 RepID=UPI001EF22120
LDPHESLTVVHGRQAYATMAILLPHRPAEENYAAHRAMRALDTADTDAVVPLPGAPASMAPLAPLPPALLTGVLRELTSAHRHRSEGELLVEALTPREREVLRCMVAGLGRKAVAERLFLSPHTVRTHMQNVLGKLGVHSTLAAVALARRAGVGPAEPGPVPPVLAGPDPTGPTGKGLGDVVERGGQLP